MKNKTKKIIKKNYKKKQIKVTQKKIKVIFKKILN